MKLKNIVQKHYVPLVLVRAPTTLIRLLIFIL